MTIPRIAVGMAVVVGCASPRPRTLIGGSGGSDGVGGQAGTGQGGGGAGGGGAICRGTRDCDGAHVVACEGGLMGPVIESCVDVCYAGRCTTGACAEAAARTSVVGCHFYGYDTDNDAADDTMVFGFPVGNVGTSVVEVKVERAKALDTWVEMIKAPVPPGQVAYLALRDAPKVGKDHHIEGTGRAYTGYRITSTGPVVAYQINSDDEMAGSSNSGSTLLLPVHVLGRQHFAITPPQRFASSPSPARDRGFISIVGAENGTNVEITVRATTAAGGVFSALKAGDVHHAVINDGEVLQLETGAVGADLSGSEITSDRPITVFAGNVCGGFDPTRAALMDCDHIEEVMYPVSTWGRRFVPLDMRIPTAAPSRAIWIRIVASEEDTTLTFESPKPLKGLPTTAAVLGRGQVLGLEIEPPIGAATFGRAHFFLESDKPIEVEAFMGDQEGGAVVVPVDQFLDDYLVSSHPYFDGNLMVTRTAGTPVTLNGAPMPDASFVPAGGGFEASFVQITRCDMDPTQCGQRVVGAKIGVTLTANGGVCNYCYAGGAGAKCVNKTAGCI